MDNSRERTHEIFVNMSDNEDLLGDDLGDQSLADYNLGNEEEEQLLADDYDHNASQNVPTSIATGYNESVDMGRTDYPNHNIEYAAQAAQYPVIDSECVVPNLSVEIPNVRLPEHSTYAPYPELPVYETEIAVVPPAIPAVPTESPQIVPSEVNTPLLTDGDLGSRARFTSERPTGAQRMPQIRDIPDSLDKVYVPRGGTAGRGRNTWRNPHYRSSHPYRRNNTHRNNYSSRSSFPPPQIRQNPEPTPHIRLTIPEIRPDIPPQPIRPELSPERTILLQELPNYRPVENRFSQNFQRFPSFRPNDEPRSFRPNDEPRSFRPNDEPRSFRPNDEPRSFRPNDEPRSFRPNDEPRTFRPNDEPRLFRPNDEPQSFRSNDESRSFIPNDEPRSFTPNVRSNFEPKPLLHYQLPYPSYPPIHDIIPSNVSHLPQVTIRQHLPVPTGIPKVDKFPPKMNLEQEVRMLPLQLPANIPPGGLAGKKVLINPHFKGNFQPLVEGLPTYIPTRIQKSPPLSPTLESKFGPIKDIDDAAERFIAEQRNALARAANRKIVRRSPQRYTETTLIEIKNDLARCSEDEELLRRQEEFINANRAGLRRRMRSPSPVRRSPSPRRSPPRRPRTDAHDEDSEYRRRLREQENLRERVLRAKEVRRRKNAVALQKQMQEKDRDKEDKDTAKEIAPKAENPKPENVKPVESNSDNNPTSTQPDKPDTTRKSPEKVEVTGKVENLEKLRERSPVNIVKDDAEINSTCENLTPPREKMPQPENVPTPDRDLTPPLPDAVRGRGMESDDELDLILDDIDGILSDEDDTGRFKEKKEPEKPKPKSQVDLRSKLPPKVAESKAPRQKIVFNEKDDRKKKEKSPARRTVVTSSTKADNDSGEKKTAKGRQRGDTGAVKSRPRIVYDKKETEKVKDEESGKAQTQTFSHRRVVLQRKPGAPPPVGIFSRAVRTVLLSGRADEPRVEYASEEEDAGPTQGGAPVAATRARVDNLPHGITDTRLRTLAGDELQSLMLNKEERTAKITFKTIAAAENFRRKFNNKMIAASRLTVTLL